MSACSSKVDDPYATIGSPPPSEAAATPVSPEIAAINQSIQSQAFDDAAARLMAMQASGKKFSAREAAEYRRAMNETYSKALEAAENGDPKAQAAVQMIRAANAR